MFTWNHRVVTFEDDCGDTRFEFAEVHYNENGETVGFSKMFTTGETLEGMRELATQLAKACELPVLNAPANWEQVEF